MKTLLLLRHAKSSWAHPQLTDFDRPLAPRGEKAAPAMGAFIAAQGLIPDRVLCSGSARTRATLALAAANWPSSLETVYDDDLYHATVPAMFAQLRAAPDDRTRLMMVGHNPGMEALAAQLVGGGAPSDLRNLAHKYPSGALAAIAFKAAHWRDIGPGDGHLTLFMRPKDLRDPG